MGNGLSGISSVAYQGTNAATPPNITTHHNRPTPNFYQNFQIGDFWVYIPLPPGNNNELWVLMGVAANIANWVLIGGGTGVLLSLTGNSGGAVFPLLGNINVVGDGTTINIVGDPATHTLTVTALDTGTVNTLTGNTGGAVGPSAGNINVVGDGTTITIVGDPLTNTLTASVIGGEAANSFPTDNGTATPLAGVLEIKGLAGGNISTSAPGPSNIVDIAVSGTTNHALQVGNSTGSLTSLSVATNGQLPIGSTGANPVIATLTAGAGINIANAAGSITISNTAINPTAANAFFAYSDLVSNAFTLGTPLTIPFNHTLFNNGGNYNTGTYTYTAPVSGYYMFVVSISLGLSGTDLSEYSMTLVTPAFNYTYSNLNPYGMAAQVGSSVSVGNGTPIFCFLNSGDTAYVQVIINVKSGSSTSNAAIFNNTGAGDMRTSFSGYQVTSVTTNPSSLCSFSAYLSTSIANVTGDSTLYTIPFNEVFFDLGSNFNTGTGYFTAPYTGIYQFAATVTLYDMGAQGTGSGMVTVLQTSGTNKYIQSNANVYSIGTGSPGNEQIQTQNSYIIALNAGDTVSYAVESTFNSGSSKTAGVTSNGGAGDYRTIFSGSLLTIT